MVCFVLFPAISLKTDFVTTSDGKIGESWTARVRADSLSPSPVLASFIFYVFNEGAGEMAFVTSKRNTIEEIYGHTPEVDVDHAPLCPTLHNVIVIFSSANSEFISITELSPKTL